MRARRAAVALLLSGLVVGGVACGKKEPADGPPAAQPKTGAVVVADPGKVVRLGRPGDLNPQLLDKISLAADDRTVKVEFYGGNSACYSVGRVGAKFEAARVTIDVLGGAHTVPANQFCTEEARLYTLTLLLDEAVAGRPVVGSVTA